VTVPTRYLLAAAVGLCLGQALPAQPPAKPAATAAAPPKPSPNQQVADTIAENLRQNAHLCGYRIDIVYQNGLAEVSGCVDNQPQKDEALNIVRGVAGVERVRDRIGVINPAPVMPVQVAMADVPAPRKVPDEAAGPGMAAPPALPPGAIPLGPGGAYPGPMEPVPIFQAGPAAGPYGLPAANMPPYAWPTYAPYNNYSRVAYPSAYPANAFPFIGPPYPFPKVPLGWRKVKLEWIDGHWYFGKTSQCYDWWRIRYW
jgi:hypothetical protein